MRYAELYETSRMKWNEIKQLLNNLYVELRRNLAKSDK